MNSFEPAEDVKGSGEERVKRQGICIERAMLIVKQSAGRNGKGIGMGRGEQITKGKRWYL